MPQIGPESAVFNLDGTVTLDAVDYKKTIDKLIHYGLFIDNVMAPLGTASNAQDFDAIKQAYLALPKTTAGLSGL